MVRDIPIIFSAPMVLAILNGRKTQTRRMGSTFRKTGKSSGRDFPSAWQRVTPGDRLWVRESLTVGATSGAWTYAADDRLIELGWPDHRVAKKAEWSLRQQRTQVPSIHMPRWASRLTLIVTSIKREHLQDISEDDAQAEGCQYVADGPEAGLWVVPDTPMECCAEGVVDCFERLWETVHGAGAWQKNPEVIAVSFEVVRSNIDNTPQVLR